jgi:hypothetical protein
MVFVFSQCPVPDAQCLRVFPASCGLRRGVVRFGHGEARGGSQGGQVGRARGLGSAGGGVGGELLVRGGVGDPRGGPYWCIRWANLFLRAAVAAGNRSRRPVHIQAVRHHHAMEDWMGVWDGSSRRRDAALDPATDRDRRDCGSVAGRCARTSPPARGLLPRVRV